MAALYIQSEVLVGVTSIGTVPQRLFPQYYQKGWMKVDELVKYLLENGRSFAEEESEAYRELLKKNSKVVKRVYDGGEVNDERTNGNAGT